MDKERLARAYVNIRDARAKATAAYEKADKELAAKQDQIASVLLAFLNEHGIDSAVTGAGTFYKQEELKPSGADWGAFYAWIKENNAFDALQRRIKVTFIREYMEENNGAIPPGVNVHRHYAVHVRRNS